MLGRFCLLLPIPILVIWVNYRTDPGNLFSGREREIADILLSGRSAANVINHDERELQRLMLEARSSEVDVLCLGSSKAMQVRPALFPGRRVYNASVSGAVLEDLIALYEVARRSGAHPETVILGLEPWIFNPNRVESRWMVLAEQYLDGARRIGVIGELPVSPVRSEQLRRLVELASPAYFQESLKMMTSGRGGEVHATDESTDVRRVLPDGSLVYDSAYGMPSATVARQRASNYAQTSMHGMVDYPQLDPADRATFERLIASLRSEGRTVVLFLSPYHPVVMDRLSRIPSGDRLVEAERFIRKVAESVGADVIGSFHPEVCGISEDDFIDGMHLKDRAVEKLWIDGRHEDGRDSFEVTLRKRRALVRFDASLVEADGPWRLEWKFAEHSPVREIEIVRSDGKTVYRGGGVAAFDTPPQRDEEYRYRAVVEWQDGTSSDPVFLSLTHREDRMGGVFLRTESVGDGQWDLTAVPNGGRTRAEYYFFFYDEETRQWVKLESSVTDPNCRTPLPRGKVKLLVKSRESGGSDGFTSPLVIVDNSLSP